ncbi:MAG: hypothetical protein HY290_22360 [Planctomycetia bacterium]|nr:hypothetical protein [Planctomycetia bacterium]
MSTPANPTSAAASDKPPRLRRRIPVALRMFAAMLVLFGGGGAVWVGVPIYRQQTAMREIHRLGGWTAVRYDGPEDLPRLAGDEWAHKFDVITEVGLGGTEFGDGDVRWLRVLTSVQHLVLFNTRVSDAGLVQLRNLTDLKRLYLHGTNVSDAGIKPLSVLSKLEALDLASTKITDASLAHIKQFSKLRRLYVSNTQVTEAALADLERALPALKIYK